MRRPRVRLRSRTRRGDGFTTEVTVIAKPELGVRVRVTHAVAGQKGQYVFDYELEPVRALARDLLNAAAYATELDAEIAGELPEQPAMASSVKRRRRR